MKKILPIIFVLMLVFTGIAAAEAPFEVTITLTDQGSDYSTAVIVHSNDQIAIKLGETDVTLTVQEKQEDGLNFYLDKKLQTPSEFGADVRIQYFLLPEGNTIEFNEPGKSSPVLTISWKGMTLPEQYEQIISNVRSVLEGNHEAGGDFSSIFHAVAGNEAAANFGFYITDLDGDGEPEMFLGENQPMSSETVFYDLYDIIDGKLVHVFDGWDRSRYYLCQNGGIAHEGSSSAFESFKSMNYYKNGELHLMQSFIYNSNVNPENPWRLSTKSEYETSDSDQLMSESDANYMLALYPYEKVELDPFIQ